MKALSHKLFLKFDEDAAPHDPFSILPRNLVACRHNGVCLDCFDLGIVQLF